jgi:RHS repeat-associated protein
MNLFNCNLYLCINFLFILLTAFSKNVISHTVESESCTYSYHYSNYSSAANSVLSCGWQDCISRDNIRFNSSSRTHDVANKVLKNHISLRDDSHFSAHGAGGVTCDYHYSGCDAGQLIDGSGECITVERPDDGSCSAENNDKALFDNSGVVEDLCVSDAPQCSSNQQLWYNLDSDDSSCGNMPGNSELDEDLGKATGPDAESEPAKSSDEIGSEAEEKASENEGDPINVTTGNMYLKQTDFTSIQERLGFYRYYNSQSDVVGDFGLGWKHSFERSITFNAVSQSSTALLVNSHNGSSTVYYKRIDGIWRASAITAGTINQSGSDYILNYYSGGSERYNAQGQLIALVSRNGDAITLTHNSGSIVISDAYSNTLSLAFTGDRVSMLSRVDGSEIDYAYNGERLATVTQPSNQAITYHYDDTAAPTRISGITNELGKRTISWSYAVIDGVEKAIRSYGDTIDGVVQNDFTFDYDTADETTVTGPLGRENTYHYKSVNGSLKVFEIDREACPSGSCSAATKYYEYNAQGLLANRTDWRGNVTMFEYSNAGQETKRTLAFGTDDAQELETQWSATHNLREKIITPGLTANYTYTAEGRIETVTQEDTTANTNSRTTEYVYNSTGLVETIKGPRTDVTDDYTISYKTGADETHLINTITNPLSHVTTINSHNGLDQPTAITDANGVSSILTYQLVAEKSLLKTSTIGNNTTTYASYADGRLQSITLPSGNTVTYKYDDNNRLTAIQNHLGERTQYTLDSAGNTTGVSIKNSGGSQTYSHSYGFDELGRLINSANFESDSIDYAYDGDKNLSLVTEPGSLSTANLVDALGRIDQITDADGNVIDMGYETSSSILNETVQDQRYNTTAYQYDGFGNVISLSSPDTGTTSFVYDAAGNLTQKTDAKFETVSYSYDALNRLTGISYSDPSQNVVYSYDNTSNNNQGIGRLTAVTKQGNTISYTYDDRGNAVASSHQVNGENYLLNQHFDQDNLLDQIAYPSGRIVDYSRNSAGQITSITTKANSSATSTAIASNIQYKAFGPSAGYTLGNGVTIDYGFDEGYRIETISADAGLYAQTIEYCNASDVQNTSANNYCPLGEIKRISDNVNSANDRAYEYDAMHRLVLETIGSHATLAYDYDAVGNRTERIVASQDNNGAPISINELYAIDPSSNRLDSVSSIISQQTAALIPAAKTFDYDLSNRLINYQENDVNVASYQHNALGQRISKTTNGETSHFVYSANGELIFEQRGAKTIEIIWFAGKPLVQIESESNGPQVVTWLVTDHLNTPRVGLDNNGVIVWRWNSKGFGDEATDNDPDGNGIDRVVNLRFTGQYYDSESGLYYNYYRDYDPTLGRYIQSDPVGINGDFYAPERRVAQSMGVPLTKNQTSTVGSLYSYVESNPLINVDPTGEWKFSASAYRGYGGSIHFGKDPRSGKSFFGVVAGAGAGGGIEFDPIGGTPSECGDSFAGVVANIGVTAGNTSVGLDGSLGFSNSANTVNSSTPSASFSGYLNIDGKVGLRPEASAGFGAFYAW